jgi:multidrug resistance efflux pump
MKTNETSSPPAESDAIPWRRIVILVSVALAAGGGVAWFLEGKGLHSFHGTIAARSTVMAANQVGHVESILVKTGQSVVPGDTLFQMACSQLQDQIGQKQREVAGYEADVSRAKATTEIEIAWRRRELQTEIFETQLKIAALSQERLNKQVEQIAWKDLLTSTESVGHSATDSGNPFRAISLELHSPDERRLQAMLREDAAAACAETLTTQIALCEERLKKLQSLDQQIESKVIASSGTLAAETRFSAAKQDLSALEAQSNSLSLVSPTYGIVGDVRRQAGDRVVQGEKLVEILDDQQPHIIAQIPSSVASTLHQGAKVTILFPAEQKRMGIISSIPPQTVSVAGLPESILEIKIEPAGKLWPRLAIGSNVKIVLP